MSFSRRNPAGIEADPAAAIRRCAGHYRCHRQANYQRRLRANITIRVENVVAVLEVMSRFAVNLKWLIYLTPTMSPSETTTQPELLEHPAEAIAYYRSNGVPQIICEEKHMGSRAVVVVCRDEDATRQRFGVTNEGLGLVYTRTGRRFFNNPVA